MREANKVTVITSKDSWYVSYAKKLINELLYNGVKASLVYSPEEISNGDICFILSFEKLINENYLKKNKCNVVCHASDLPQGKGWSPMTWQILEGKKNITVSMFEASSGIDSGEIYNKKEFLVEGHELLNELRFKLAETIEAMALDFTLNVNDYIKNVIKQVGAESFYKKRMAADSKIDPEKSIKEIFNMLQVADNEKYPVFFELKGYRYILKCQKGIKV